MIRKQREATPVQRLMIFLMFIAYGSMFVWLIPEVRGILDPAVEDTYSEWVWDLARWAVLTIAFIHLLAGIAFIWSAGHFIEGFIRRLAL